MLSEPGSTVSVLAYGGLAPAGTVTVTVTLCPAASDPELGLTVSSLAGAEAVMLNFTGPPSAVSVNDPAYGPPAAGWLSTTRVVDDVNVPGDGGGVRDGDGEAERLRDTDGVGVAPRDAAGLVAAG
jgi:hypothetical protein